MASMAAFALQATLPASAETPDTRRIVSIGGVVTEILWSLGADDRIIAVDTTSIFPAEALRTRASVGYMRQLSAEGILALEPSVILMLEGSGPPQAVDVLEQSGVDIREISNEPGITAAAQRIRAIAEIVGEAEAGERHARRLVESAGEVSEVLQQQAHRPRVLYLLNASPDRLVAAGSDTAAHAIIELAGGRNVGADFNGYKQISIEAVASLDPQAIILMNRDGHDGDPAQLLSQPLIAATSAGRSGRIAAFEGQLLLGFGPRLAEAVRTLGTWLHPDAQLPVTAHQAAGE